MEEFELYGIQLEKFNGILAERNLVAEFKGDKYPVQIEITRKTNNNQQNLFTEEKEESGAKIVLTFPIGKTIVSFDGKIALEEKMINKIKSQAKKLHDLFLQSVFAAQTRAE